MLNRYHLQILLEQIERARTKPTIAEAFPWGGLLLAFLLAIVPGSFHDTLGIPAGTWLAGAWGGVVLSVVMMLKAAVKAWEHRKEQVQSAAEMVEELLSKLREQRQQPSHPLTASTPSTSDTGGSQR